MKKTGFRQIRHIYIIFLILLVGMLIAGFGMFLYNITIQKPNGGITITKWPIDFTSDFSSDIVFVGETLQVKQSGLRLLQENGLWLQIINTSGDELQSFEKPQGFPSHYSPSDLLKLYQYGTEDYSVFFGRVLSGDKEITYMIGFPIQIRKITTYYNGDRYATVKPIAYTMMGIALLLLILSGGVYNYIIAKQISKVRESIRKIASRTYRTTINNEIFGDVYEELNDLSMEIKYSDEMREKNEKLREEWIANITHDLKTPLSPIKGYAELIAGPEAETEPDKVRKYGNIILKNAAYVDDLINDLKLTYQLKSEMLPLNKCRNNLVRFTKELIIDLFNHPDYEARDIVFHSSDEQADLMFDTVLLKRALNNLIVNALIHSGSDTRISVCITASDSAEICIQDNGRGMSKEELEYLFIRYYRGGNTDSKTEGSGLGMAIAKQIIELHGGSIIAESELGAGTRITIKLPLD